jgi:hypothetical protein
VNEEINGEMKTKKLVLGVCILAAVTVAVPQVFGTILVPVLSKDLGRREAYEEELAFTARRLKEETTILADMGDEEVRCIKDVLFYEYHAHFFAEINDHNYQLAINKVGSILESLEDAKRVAELAERRIFAPFAKRSSAAKVEELRLELAKAKKHRERMFIQLCYGNAVANGYRDVAQKLRDHATELHAERLALFTKLSADEIDRREASLLSDEEKIEQLPDIYEIEGIRMRSVQDRIILQEFDTRIQAEAKFAISIKDAIRNHTNDSWSRIPGTSNDSLWQYLLGTYNQKALVYDDDQLMEFIQQSDLLTNLTEERSLTLYRRVRTAVLYLQEETTSDDDLDPRRYTSTLFSESLADFAGVATKAGAILVPVLPPEPPIREPPPDAPDAYHYEYKYQISLSAQVAKYSTTRRSGSVPLPVPPAPALDGSGSVPDV